MIRLSVRADIRRVTKNLKMTRRQIGVMVGRAINKAARFNRTHMARDVRAMTSLRVGKINRAMVLRLASGSVLSRLEASVKAKRERQSLSYFQRPIQTAKGVKVTAWGIRKLYPHTFMATMDSGHVGIFSRAKRVQKRVGRLPLHELHGPEIPETMALREIMDRARDRSSKKFLKELKRLAALQVQP